MIYGNLRSTFSPRGQEYVTPWNPTQQLANALSGNSPLSAGTVDSPLSGTRSQGSPASGASDFSQSKAPKDETGTPSGVQFASAAPVAGAVPGVGFSLADLTPSMSGLASFGGSVVGSALGGPVGGALGGFAGGQAAGQGLGRGAGSAIGGLLGGALGPIGAIGGSILGGYLGGQADGNGYSAPNGPIGPGYVDNNQTNAYSDIGLSSAGGNTSGGGEPGSSVDSSVGGGSGEVSGEGAPGGYAKGGHVTRDRLHGPNPPGPDDGYAALDAGEFVIKASDVKKLGGPDKTRARLAKLLAGK